MNPNGPGENAYGCPIVEGSHAENMFAKVFDFPFDKNAAIYREEACMKEKLLDVISQFVGKVSIASTLGVLDMVHADILAQSREE